MPELPTMLLSRRSSLGYGKLVIAVEVASDEKGGLNSYV